MSPNRRFHAYQQHLQQQARFDVHHGRHLGGGVERGENDPKLLGVAEGGRYSKIESKSRIQFLKYWISTVMQSVLADLVLLRDIECQL